jgi:predicted glycogen debranching enzyme
MNVSLTDFSAEWLETDGSGGFASGTVAGPRTRRYHALLLTATTPPTGRVVLVNGLIAWIEDGRGETPLSTQCYTPGILSPDSRARLKGFSRHPWPSWTMAGHDDSIFIHDVFVARDSGETVLRWRRQSGTGPCRLNVRLLLSGRDYHSLHHENPVFAFDDVSINGNVSWRPYPSLPAISALTNGTYSHAPDWFRNFLYMEEQSRGLDDTEDLASPGIFTFDLARSEAVMVLRAGSELDVITESYASGLRARAMVSRNLQEPLQQAAGCYNVARGAGRTLIAGFPWFTDWGRDTFIAMRGLLLVTGELQAAQDILCSWAGLVSEGMLPNRFPDDDGVPEYNAVDASLWYIVAVHDFLESARIFDYVVSNTTVDTLRGACEAILTGYTAGTRFGIKPGSDGLLAAGTPGMQLTWMDAITNGHVVTPRIGKPVEIQALWINALEIGGRRWSAAWAVGAGRARAAFAARFSNPAGGLYDVIDEGHVAGVINAQVRPNQVFAVGGLPFAIIEGAQAREIVDTVESKLLIPLGLRSLAPGDPDYHGRYAGGPSSRDGAYHQGTAWPWLLGPFVDAWLAVRDHTKAAKSEARERFLPPLVAHLEEAGLGHVSEIVDGDAPHAPGGCPFQAWSLGELIRIRAMLA